MITITVNNRAIRVEEGTTVAAAVIVAGVGGFRRSISGESRGPLCGIGVCFECRVTIDGVSLSRSCNVLAADGMEVVANG